LTPAEQAERTRLGRARTKHRRPTLFGGDAPWWLQRDSGAIRCQCGRRLVVEHQPSGYAAERVVFICDPRHCGFRRVLRPEVFEAKVRAALRAGPTEVVLD
jgi:hypothetical protein